MTTEQIFQTHSLFQSVNYDSIAESWRFTFDNNLSFHVAAFWRLLQDKAVKIASPDHGHTFGHNSPLDIAYETTKALTGKFLTEVRILPYTGDLILSISDHIVIQVFISSTGYESFDFYIDHKRIIGMGSGEIAVFKDTP